MNRIIKFRVYDKVSKKMFYSEQCLQGSNGFVEYVTIYTGYTDSDEWRNYTELMQFTGLTDKNGKEIYEGDIVKFDGHSSEDKFIASILFKNGRFIDSYYGYNIGKYREVIGNIYENSELLEESK